MFGKWSPFREYGSFTIFFDKITHHYFWQKKYHKLITLILKKKLDM